MILMLWLTALVLHALRVAGIRIYPRNNSDSVVVTYPRLPLTRLGGYWGSGIFLSCYCTFSLSSLLRGVFMYGPGFTPGIDHWRWGQDTPQGTPPPRIPSLFLGKTLPDNQKFGNSRFPVFP